MSRIAWVIVVVGFIVIAVGIIVLVMSWNDREWQIANSKARWEDYATTAKNMTEVGVRKVARRGRRTKIISKEVNVYIDNKEVDWMHQVHKAQYEASNQADVLNSFDDRGR